MLPFDEAYADELREEGARHRRYLRYAARHYDPRDPDYLTEEEYYILEREDQL